MLDSLRRYLNSSTYLRELKDAILRQSAAGHELTVFPDDVFLVSYLRSGQTWSRFLIANLRDPSNPTTFSDITDRVPGINTHSDRFLQALPRPRVMVSHKSFFSYYPSVIYIVRDPRDVAISRYYYELKLGNIDDGHLMEDFIRSFVSGEIDEYRRAGGWGDHVLSWLAMRMGHSNFMLMRYEDLKSDTMGQLRRVASFMGLGVDDKTLERSIRLSSKERMRELDQNKPLGFLRGTRPDVPFVRKDVAGGWSSQLSETSIRTIESAWWPLMELLGYKLICSQVEREITPQINFRTSRILSSFLARFEENWRGEMLRNTNSAL
ncbi:MAG TPA: sulfotransferase domain-containing protein [Candidatus Acidoferrales bacterium]|nr:sulfotransferase domain-containing protein [Candidatus Acidoferrales bacterium]